MKRINSLFVILVSWLCFTGCIDESRQGADKYSIQAPTERHFPDFNVSVHTIYGLKGKLKIDSLTTNETLYTKFDYAFELKRGERNYYVINSFFQFHNTEDLMKGWDLLEESFWFGVFSEGADTSEFNFFRNADLFKLGDYSEYSELRKPSGEIAVIYHVRIFNTILHYAYVIDPNEKERLMQLLVKKIEKLKPFLRLKTAEKNIPKN